MSINELKTKRFNLNVRVDEIFDQIQTLRKLQDNYLYIAEKTHQEAEEFEQKASSIDKDIEALKATMWGLESAVAEAEDELFYLEHPEVEKSYNTDKVLELI